MSRYIKATNGVTLHDPMTGKPVPSNEIMQNPMRWNACVRALFGDPRFQKMLDIFALIDLRTKLLALTPEDPAVAISDDEGRALESVCKKPETFTPAFLFSPGAEEFFRAFTDAPTKNPLNAAAKVVDEPSPVVVGSLHDEL